MTTVNSPQPRAGSWAVLAGEAAADVNARFGHRLMCLPGTWIGSLSTAAPPTAARTWSKWPWSEWHYWWQAHYLDALLDTAQLALARGDRRAAHLEVDRARQLLRGIMIRNFGRFPNYFYDDMAWLALAAQRLNGLSRRLSGAPVPLANCAVATLTRQLRGAHDSMLGGGIYWSRKRDYKNTPANGPAALLFARTGDATTAQALSHWLRTELFDSGLGLYVDGIHPARSPATATVNSATTASATASSAAGRDVERTIYTYNQGPILGTLLQLGRAQDLAAAAALIDSIRRHLSTPAAGLRLEPGGDGSLFTGILCRYLALAAQDARLPGSSRGTASELIRRTAGQLLPDSPQQLSAALQRWTIFSAAATL